MRLLIILLPTVRSLVLIKFLIKILSPFAVMADFFSLRTLGAFRSKLWVIYLFDQVILMLFLVSHLLAQSTKTRRHCIIALLHCTIPYASSHKHQFTSVFITLSKSVNICHNLECILYNLVAIDCFVGLL
jgi:hypothetical protein